jgi:hypothetical protein
MVSFCGEFMFDGTAGGGGKYSVLFKSLNKFDLKACNFFPA